MAAAGDPAKCDPKQMSIELAMLDFCPGGKRALQAHRRLIGLIGTSFLGTCICRLLMRGFTSFPSRLGIIQVSEGLALTYINHYIVYLGFETTLGWFGEGLVTLTHGVVG